MKFIKNTGYWTSRKLDNIFGFIDSLIEINDGNKFENHYSETYPLEAILKNEHFLQTETAFQDLHLYVNGVKFNKLI